MNHPTIPETSEHQEAEPPTSQPRCPLCAIADLSECVCTPVETSFSPSNSNGTIFKGLIVNNPNNPGLSIKEGAITYSSIEGVPLADIAKAKLCLRNEFILINTLQLYAAQPNAKPVCFGLDPADASLWLLAVIQAKLILAFQINIGNARPQSEAVTGVLFKRTVMGKWKTSKAVCSTLPPSKQLRLEDEYTSIGSTSEIWTRFEMVRVREVECLVVKLWGTLGKKELAIPVGQVALWVRALCSLLG